MEYIPRDTDTLDGHTEELFNPNLKNGLSNEDGKKLGEKYLEIMGMVQDKKLMSAILDIEETEDDHILFRVFVERYKDFCLGTKERQLELYDQLRKKILKLVFPKE